MTGIHFAHPSNRFWPALQRAGILGWVPDVSPAAPSVRIGGMVDIGPAQDIIAPLVDTSGGMTDAQRGAFTRAGLGITNLVDRATARAAQLGPGELREGAARLQALVGEAAPRLVAVAGISAYRVAFSKPAATVGMQDEKLAGSELWAVPNPSGLNAHETVDSLAVWFRKLYEAAN